MKLKIESTFDKRIFTFYAALNATGYDLENNKEGMHPLRLTVRKYILEKDLNLKKLEKVFSDHHKEFYWELRLWTLCHSNPPDYDETSPVWRVKIPPNTIKGFKDSMVAFYHNADIDSNYKFFEKEYRPLTVKLRKLGGTGIKEALNFLKLKDLKSIKKVIIIPNLLDGYGVGIGPTVEDISYCIIGPRKSDNGYLRAIQHEFLHAIINPLTENLEEIKALHKINPRTNWKSKIREYLIRSICIVLNYNKVADQNKKTFHLEKDGFEDIDFFVEKMKLLDKYNGSFEGFLSKVLLDFTRFKNR